MTKKQSNPPPPDISKRPKAPPGPPRIQSKFCPYMREMIDCFNDDSLIREVIVKKRLFGGNNDIFKEL